MAANGSTTAPTANGHSNGAPRPTFAVKAGLAQMLKGGVIMDVVNVEQAKIAEAAGACAVMALQRIPSDIRKDGGVARMSDPKMIKEIMEAVSIPVMAKSRIGHIVEAEILQAIGVDYIDESEVLTPADPSLHLDKHVRFRRSLCLRLQGPWRGVEEDQRRRCDDPHEGRSRHRQRDRSRPARAQSLLPNRPRLDPLRNRAVQHGKRDQRAGRPPPRNGQVGSLARGHVFRRRDRDARGCGADDEVGNGRGIRRLRNLQILQPRRPRTRHRTRHDALQRPFQTGGGVGGTGRGDEGRGEVGEGSGEGDDG
ncbi:RHTO0S20e01728g1_1 [Rhodotorula toruloides]|uniref:RHTO0S20e01728g1_1 n=1 Tax=Rhodotorula toruloides TaxID=5286 RepID=A0A061BP02_RHOTO|nr:RHTO0S20e01728g1_1 [Rhodotorula toruloides]